MCLLGFEARTRGRTGESRLEAQDRLRVELGDAGLCHPEHLPDLAKGELLVVVQGDHELLALRQARNRVSHRLLHLGLGKRALRIRRVRILDRVDEGDLVALARDGPELVEGGDRGAGDVRQARIQLLDRDPDLLRDLLVGRRAPGLRLERRDRALDLPRAGSHRSDRKSTRLNSSHVEISYAVFCLKKKKKYINSLYVLKKKKKKKKKK